MLPFTMIAFASILAFLSIVTSLTTLAASHFISAVVLAMTVFFAFSTDEWFLLVL